MILFCKSYDDILLIICTCAQPSLCEAAALLVDELLDPAREVAAQAIDVEAGPCEPLDSDPGLRSFRGGFRQAESSEALDSDPGLRSVRGVFRKSESAAPL